jgi:3-dehydroquinate synthase
MTGRTLVLGAAVHRSPTLQHMNATASTASLPPVRSRADDTPAQAPISASLVRINLGDRSYPIMIGQGLLHQPQTWAGLPVGAQTFVVTNSTVAAHHGQAVQAALQSRGHKVSVVSLPDGEQFKTWDSLNLIFDALLSHGADRHTLLVALGGGVVGDITGFAAACYMRGVPFVQVPTTLLAQVDSSVGGKTAINHPLGKNMIGAFYQPLQVVCDLDTLATLPAREISAGLAEVIKYGPIADMTLLAWLEAHITDLRGLHPQAMAHAVARSCEIKAQVVGADERESGLRAILNFGHTFGHAMEAGLGYGHWLHGEAVGAGMVMAAELSCRLGGVDRPFVRRLARLIAAAGLPVQGPVLDAHDNAGRYLQWMRLDKKSVGGDIRFVVLSQPGQAAVQSAPDALVRDVIDYCCSSAVLQSI